VSLLSTRKELQDAIQQARDTVVQNGKELDTANAADPAERLKFLNSELATAQAHKLEAQNSLAATEENIKRLIRPNHSECRICLLSRVAYVTV
jgi:chromosome segregation ATPase